MAEFNNYRRLLLTLETLAELGPELTADRDFNATAETVISSVTQAVGAAEGALFVFQDKPASLQCVAQVGFMLFPEKAAFPLLPRHVHAISTQRSPRELTSATYDEFLSTTGNIAREIFRCLVPLKVKGKLVGTVLLGRRVDDAGYREEDLQALAMISHYVALTVNNHLLGQTLAGKIAENLRLITSMHGFYEHTLAAFANAIDVKNVHTQGHSLRVGRYSAGIGEAMGLESGAVAELRAAGYLHDIGKVTVDKYIFSKTSKLDATEFQEMADHTVVGHRIVSGVQFPWNSIPEVVRWHHERTDGTGYPDKLHRDEMPLPARVAAVADVFDAMLSERPYRPRLSVGEAANQLVRMAPEKLDNDVVQALLVQLRRDAAASMNAQLWKGRSSDQGEKPRFLDEQISCTVSPTDIDNLAAQLHHRISRGRIYSA